MGPYFKCCKCETEGKINPKVEYLYEEIEKEIEVTKKMKSGKDKIIKEKRMIAVPLIAKKKTQNFATGEIIEKEFHASKDLEVRIFQVGIRFADQQIQVDLCSTCIEKTKEHVNPLWKHLEEIKCQ